MSANDSEHALLSLQEFAIKTIVKNIERYRDLITKKIAPPMRKRLFDEAMARKREIGEDQVWAALPYLDLHRTTESFSTRDFASIFPLKGESGEISGGCVSMEEFLQYLVEFIPNLRQLDIVDPRRRSSHTFYNFKKVQLEPLATDLLLKMQNLTHLSIIDVNIQFSGFVRVCRENQNWQSIEANNILVDIEPNSIKQFLTTLDSKFDHQEYDAREFPREIGITLKKTDADVPYRQAKVCLSSDVHDLFPSLTELEIRAPEDGDLSVGDTQIERNRLFRILSREGGTLKTLILDSIRPELDVTFKQIFEHCNVIETLHLRDSNVSDDEPIASFGQLKILTWNETFDQYGTIRLDKIFSAPFLKKIYIDAFKFELGDKVSLLERIRNRTILTQLTIFVIFDVGEYDEEDLNEFSSELRFLGVEVSIPDLD